MKKKQITLLTCTVGLTTIILSILLIIVYQNINKLLSGEGAHDKILQQIKVFFYYIFISGAFLTIFVALLLRHYSKLHAAEASALVTLNTKVDVVSKRMDDILKSISDPFFALDENYNFVFLNRIASHEFAVGCGSLLGINYLKVYGEMAQHSINEKMKEVMQSRESVSFEAKDFLGRWRDISIYPTSEGISVHSKDAGERKSAQEHLRKTEQLLKETNLVAMVGGWEVDLIANTVLWTDATYLIHEQDPDFKPDLEKGINYYKEGISRNTILRLVQHTVETGETWDAELEIVTAKGNEKWIRTKGIAEFRNGGCVRLFGIFQDITLKKQAEDLLVSERKLLQTIIDNLPMNVYVKDTNHKKVLVNTNGKKHQQADNAEVLAGKYDDELYPEEYAETSIQEDTQVFETGISILDRETALIKFDGATTYFLTSKIPYYSENGHVEGLVGINYNITGIKDKALALQQANAALESVTNKLADKNQELEHFASVASHDLQEPLRMITGFIALIEKKYSHSLDEKGKEYLKHIVDGAVRMRQIITDILEYSRTGLSNESIVELDFNKLITKLVADNFSEAINAGAVIKYENLPMIVAEKTSMSQLFINLISNALKYQAPGNKPVINLKVKFEADMWQFAISDNGIGIKADYYEKIFLIFKRLHTRSEYSGTGVGLAICKKIVNKYKGEIWLKSVYGSGTTFYFTLPTSPGADKSATNRVIAAQV